MHFLTRMQLMLDACYCCCCFSSSSRYIFLKFIFFPKWKQKPNNDHMWFGSHSDSSTTFICLFLSLGAPLRIRLCDAGKAFNILIIFSCILAQLKLPREHYINFPFMFTFRLKNEEKEIGERRALCFLVSLSVFISLFLFLMLSACHSLFCYYFILIFFFI